MVHWKPGRLFWKLVFALCMSMVLSVAGAVAFLLLTGRQPPPADDLATIGIFPIVPMISGALAILCTGLVLAWYLARPLQHLRWALHEVAQGRLDTRIQPLMHRRNDEIADLAQDFDRMASQLQQLTESRTILLHNISHELRSPLARIQAALGLMGKSTAPQDLDALTQRIRRESEALDSLVGELLTLHRLDGRSVAYPHCDLDVIELVDAIAEDAHFEAQAALKSVVLRAPDKFIADVNGELVYQAIENVVRNAVKFSPRGKGVEIEGTIINDGKALEIVVSDRGSGVPRDQLDNIFDPFVRVGGTESIQGTGLGLAIARRAIELHGGKVSAAPRNGGGLVVKMMLLKQWPH
ncbi:HAMP domain-containing histidine kinase [Pseudomonas fulva]|uniref:HAMP domain-containing sensor histidine kinase n=1 Tax=Pseudomonas fulva TaxID=47880 RepID=UPI00201D9D35|nr:HAMP domain-containing sensor histidine kinase [Pseudomonas fulva]UQY33030.1 HAMP domain-containing histidine kinase [Pseudomonas fulva]